MALRPRILRLLPLIFAWSLAILMACSQLLLVQSTSKSAVKYSTWSIRLAIRLASLSASLLRPLTPGALAATPCSAVLAYRSRSAARVPGGRLTALASTAASTARRALVRVWRICAAQAWPCGSASQTACRSRIRWAQHSWTPVTFPPRPGSLYWGEPAQSSRTSTRGEAGQDAKAVGGGVAAVLVRPVPDQAVGAGGVDVAGPAVDRHRRLVVVELVGVGQPGQAGGDESGRDRAAQQVRQQRRGAFHADLAQVGDLRGRRRCPAARAAPRSACPCRPTARPCWSRPHAAARWPRAARPPAPVAPPPTRRGPAWAEDRTRGDMISLVRIRSSRHAASQRAA